MRRQGLVLLTLALGTDAATRRKLDVAPLTEDHDATQLAADDASLHIAEDVATARRAATDAPPRP